MLTWKRISLCWLVLIHFYVCVCTMNQLEVSHGSDSNLGGWNPATQQNVYVSSSCCCCCTLEPPEYLLLWYPSQHRGCIIEGCCSGCRCGEVAFPLVWAEEPFIHTRIGLNPILHSWATQHVSELHAPSNHFFIHLIQSSYNCHLDYTLMVKLTYMCL